MKASYRFQPLLSSYFDIKIKPDDGNVVYAAGQTVEFSTDAGDSWQEPTGLPATNVARIAIGVTPSKSNNVYAIVSYSILSQSILPETKNWV